MKARVLQHLQDEYRFSREQTQNEIHDKWRAVMDEYRMKSFAEVHMWVHRHVNDPEWALSSNAARGSLHMITRKMLSLISLKDPDFNIRSRDPKSDAIAHVLDDAFPHEVRRMDWNKKFRVNNLWSLLTGTGVTKLGLDSVFQYGELATAANIPSNTNVNSELMRKMEYGFVTEYMDPSVQMGEVNIINVPTTDVFSNPGARDWNTVTRLYVRYLRPIQDIYRDARYDNVRRDVPNVNLDDPKYNKWLSNMPDDQAMFSKYGEVVECFDFASRNVCVFNEGIDKPLIDWYPFTLPIFCPYKFFTPIESLSTWRGVPYGLRILDQCKSINHLRALLKDKIARDGKTVFMYDSTSITDPEVINKLRVARDGDYVDIPGMQDLIDKGKEPIVALEFGKPSPELLRLISIFEADLQFMSGLDDPTRNVQSNSSMSATEVRTRQNQQELIIEDYIDQNEKFQEDCAGDVLRLILKYWPHEKMVKVVGPSAESYFWLPVLREHVQGSFTLEVVAGSTQRLDRATYRRQLLETIDRITALAQVQSNELASGVQSGIDWKAVMQLLLDEFVPGLGQRILSQRDLPSMMISIMQQIGISPASDPNTGLPFVSPDLLQQLNQRAQQVFEDPFGAQAQQAPQGMQQPGNVVPIPGAGPSPRGIVGPDGQGVTLQDFNGFQAGRQLSETQGANF